jgi:hypothetical protein
MNPIICQIRAIAALAVVDNADPAFRESELLSIRLALAEALDAVDGHLRWRRELRRERPGRHSEETA